ncbi:MULTISPECIES: hotdog fold thioesterase [Reichenbachiella]|uniref:hotdog fold thioesterase n=1 Tax=Reichenbachiella TaxID=156993 RepID=UPI000E6B9B46|nr:MULTISPECIES: hotdog fold thioesterase [Reichenbachiella]MBU2913326.1 hotdog fold thioesterase [Reichenbachiella agariperforans]RJE74687.1 thioesterase [Reichenbachiella sp. MSK19-1]
MFNEIFTLEAINDLSQNTLLEHIGIQFTEIGTDYLKATMPVDSRTHQPMGLLHGGASVVLAESLGSVAAQMTIDPHEQYCVGLDINANHIKSVREGVVEGIATPLHRGKKTQVWEIKIYNEKKELVCVSRITMAILDRKK